MIRRHISEDLLESLNFFQVVAIVGARQVGKTTLAKMLSAECKKESIYLDMEKTSDLNKLQDAELYFSQNKNKLIIIDEV